MSSATRSNRPGVGEYVGDALLASIVDSSDDAIVGKTLDGTIVTWNKAAERMYGYTADEIVGEPISILTPPQSEEMDAILRRVREGERIAHYQTLRVRKDGSIVPIALTVSPIYDDRGEIIGASSIGRDITERVRADARLRDAAEYARSLIEASLDPLVTISPEGQITDVNEATVKVTGVARDALIGTDFADYFTEPDEARAGYRRVFDQGFVTDYPLTIRHRDGSRTEVLYNASVYRDSAGEVLGVLAAARDVTELNKSVRYARSLIEASLDPLVTISPEGQITDVNEATVKVTGVARDALIGTDFADYFTEPERARAGYRQVFDEGFVTDYPLTIRHRDGSRTEVLYNASVYRDSAGEVLGVFAAARDVNELNKSVRYARSLIEASLDPLVTISPEGQITDVNEATVKVTGVARDALIGTDFADYFTDPEQARLGYRTVYADGAVRDFPLTIRHRDGALTDVLYNASLYRDSAGNVLGVFAAARDVTALKAAEREIMALNDELERRVAERTEELEAFTYSVSHDLRAPLRALDGFSGAVVEHYGDRLDERGRHYLSRVRAGAQQMGTMIDELLQLSRVSRSERRTVHIDMSSLARDVVAELRAAQPDRDVEVGIEDGMTAEADPALVRIVLANLLGNAWKFTATREGARIEFAAVDEDGQTAYVVRDNGVGFDMRYAHQLFQPFQRLHSVEEFPGNGIGLASVRRIIQRHGGRIEGRGEIGAGATFTFTLAPKGEQR